MNKLSDIVFRIEHVGSTSVKGLSAKPKLDIDIVIQKEVSFEVFKKKLSELGYFHRGDLDVEGREVFDRNNSVYDVVLDNITHNLYACYEGNIELEKHMLSGIISGQIQKRGLNMKDLNRILLKDQDRTLRNMF